MVDSDVFGYSNNYPVMSKEHPVSGGAKFPDHVLMSVTVRLLSVTDRVNPNSNPNPF